MVRYRMQVENQKYAKADKSLALSTFEQSSTNKAHGLGTRQAVELLLTSLASTLAKAKESFAFKKKIKSRQTIRLAYRISLATIILGLLSAIIYKLYYLQSGQYSTYKIIGLIIFGISIMLFLGIELALELFIHIRLTNELTNRCENVISSLFQQSTHTNNIYVEEIKEPISRAISFVKTLRDGMIRWVPVNMLVTGDVVEWSPALAGIKCLPLFDGSNLHNIIQQYNQYNSYQKFSTKCQLVTIAEIPAVAQMNEALQDCTTALKHQKSYDTMVEIIGGAFTGLALLAMCLEMLIRKLFVPTEPFNVLIGEIALSSLVMLIPVFVFTSSLGSIWIRLYSNSRLHLMAALLLRSKTPFDESGDVDEFDEEAPPPTKDLYIGPQLILSKMLTLFGIGNTQRNYCKPPNKGSDSTMLGDRKQDSGLFWTVDLTKVLGSLSVLIFTDREGVLTLPFELPELLLIPSKLAKESVASPKGKSKQANSTAPLAPKLDAEDNSMDFSTIEVYIDPANPTGLRLNYADSGRGPNELKAIGLSFLLATDCGIQQGQPTHFKRDWHRRVPMSLLKHLPGKFGLDLQTCPCLIAKSFGFLSSISLRYHRICEYWMEPEGCFVSIVKHISSNVAPNFTDAQPSELQMIIVGNFTKLATYCAYAWDGKNIGIVTTEYLQKMAEMNNSLTDADNNCVGYFYRPLGQYFDEAVSANNKERNISLLKHQETGYPLIRAKLNRLIFLGMVASCLQDSDNVQECVDDLDSAGIRFVYFSPYSESITKAFGDRLGLETDWNSCIILHSAATNKAQISGDVTKRLTISSDQFEFSHPKSKLPKGVSNVRPHLEKVDDIPLHVSLFAECDGQSMREMVKIYREYGEIVGVVGSALNYDSAMIFGAAQLAIAMEPSSLWSVNNRKSFIDPILNISLALTSLRASLIIPFDTSPYVFTELIREARLLYRCIVSMIVFSTTACCLTMTVMGVSEIFLLRNRKVATLLPISVCIAISFLVTPLLAASYFWSPYEPQIMKLMPSRLPNEEDGAFAIKLLICNFFIQVGWIVGFGILARHYQAKLLIISFDVVTIVSLTLTIGVQSGVFMHLVESVESFPPYKNVVWAIVSLAILVLFIIIVITTTTTAMLIKLEMWVMWCFILGSIVGAIVFGGIIPECLLKRAWRERVKMAEKRAKLEFNTRLGMHSPI